jgi:hypothetical protein
LPDGGNFIAPSASDRSGVPPDLDPSCLDLARYFQAAG